jgi:hypothetical protein
MIVTLQTQALESIDQIRAFLDGSEDLDLKIQSREEAYQFVGQTLRLFRYRQRCRTEKGLLRRYLIKVTGLSRAQITRLITQQQTTGVVTDRRGAPAQPFARRFTDDDVRTLAEIDALHGTLSGNATRRLCERAWSLFGDQRFERLATISHGHLYNLRQSPLYLRRHRNIEKTRPRHINIAERRRPQPEGRPGFLRVDSVHQGNYTTQKGLFHINVVDEVTQFEFIGAVSRISDRELVPLLEALICDCPFTVLGVHADNGSEYINRKVADMLQKLNIREFTKSRPRRSNDNALVESKNGTVIRRQLGYSPIPQRFADPVNTFHREALSPYLNYHRPCYFPTVTLDERGKQLRKYHYEDIQTPYERLKSLPNAAQYLRAEISFEQLDELAYAISDNEAARQLSEARQELFKLINGSQRTVA